ncbi:unnamed protein product [Porites evermanni]|uniref:Dual specificity protein phosphatase 22 n=1 Tax=Porites evermanni TaxID=104178 RepID=A0ABN8LGC5_9CNID|nr:unnamed protein product [Porites evermanni]
MGNGMNKVLPGLYLGNFRDAKDMEQLKQNKITHVLSIHDNAQPVLEHLKYKCINAADSPDQEISVFFQECIDFIHNCRINNGACLVHCMAGISRSTTIVAAYIMAVTELNWKDSIKAIKCSRSIANPNYGFQRQLQDFWNLQASKVRYLHVLYSDCFVSVTTGFQWFALETFRFEPDENDYNDLIIFAYSKKIVHCTFFNREAQQGYFS